MKVVYDIETKKEVPLDLDEVIKSRMLLQANSGGGKSHIIRKIAEESHGIVQQIIIDKEGEFHTLREKYEYILVAKSTDDRKADIELDVKHAPLLARKLMETGASAIIDLYEMNPAERIRFVKVFLDSLVNLPKKYWHKCLIIIDEAHIFAPESKGGRSESLESVASLASLGRKRRFALICATQRISKFNKDVSAELNTKFIGRCSQDNDRKRAAEELDIKDSVVLRKLKHEFYAFGPAISDDIIKVKAYETKTESEDPDDLGEYKVKDVGKMLQNFSELPQEAENQLKTEKDLRKKIDEQTLELRKLKKQQPQVDPQKLQMYHDQGISKGYQNAKREFEKKVKELEFYIRKLQSCLKGISVTANTHSEMKCIEEHKEMVNNARETIENSPMTEIPQTKPSITKYAAQSFKKELNTMIAEDMKLGRCARAILETLAKFGKPCTKAKVGIFSNYSHTSGGFSNALSQLRSLGFAEGTGNSLEITEAGIIEAGNVEPLPTDSSTILEFWKNKTGKCAGAILENLYNIYPNTSSKEQVGEETGYSANSGGFSNSLSKLRTLGLIEGSNDSLKASDEMFVNI